MERIPPASLSSRLPLLLFLLLVACLLLPATARTLVFGPFNYCSRGGQFGTDIRSFEVYTSPTPVVAGMPSNFTILGRNEGNSFAGGKVQFEVSQSHDVGLIYECCVDKGTQDLCSYTSCPIRNGYFHLYFVRTLQINAKGGYFLIKLKIFDNSGTELQCIRFTFTAKAA